ncbi:PRC-barrel domain-containing protein [Pseudolabrys sp. FHR47]|uniref:PRC-barrel domain-containing protein n=1 Tax=Pseudolabrys sp. FHR47 TaxID=2562284 RepID=UPI00143DBEE6|nr:PRC-barrel domain-containing protein [Pseudolabrys sp. FHR47]
MMKRTLTAAALATVLAMPAFAQSTTMPPANTNNTNVAPTATSKTNNATMNNASGGFVSSQQSTDWLGSKLIGASVYGPDNASIGEINDVVIGGDGKINAVVVGVGGFLGVGEKSIALPFEAISVARKPDLAAIDKITVSYTKDQLKNAPTFAYYEPASRSTTGSGAMGSGSSATKPMNTTPPKQ